MENIPVCCCLLGCTEISTCINHTLYNILHMRTGTVEYCKGHTRSTTTTNAKEVENGPVTCELYFLCKHEFFFANNHHTHSSLIEFGFV